jgi:hypothetical protein
MKNSGEAPNASFSCCQGLSFLHLPEGAYYDGTELWVFVATMLVALPCLWFGWFIGTKQSKHFFESHVRNESGKSHEGYRR